MSPNEKLRQSDILREHLLIVFQSSCVTPSIVCTWIWCAIRFWSKSIYRYDHRFSSEYQVRDRNEWMEVETYTVICVCVRTITMSNISSKYQILVSGSEIQFSLLTLDQSWWVDYPVDKNLVPRHENFITFDHTLGYVCTWCKGSIREVSCRSAEVDWCGSLRCQMGCSKQIVNKNAQTFVRICHSDRSFEK